MLNACFAILSRAFKSFRGSSPIGIITSVLFGPFLFLYAVLFVLVLGFLFALIEIHVINYVFTALGLPPGLALVALLVSLIGSYLNIPITKVDGGPTHQARIVSHFGIRYRLPARYTSESTTVAVNVGGAIVPLGICAYVLFHFPGTIVPAVIGTAIVTVVVYRFARPVPGMGIATPMLVPPIVAAIVAYVLSALMGGTAHHADVVAYVSGVIGTLVGADLFNLNRLGELGAPVASIGGAGTFDGIFLTGIVAVLLA